MSLLKFPTLDLDQLWDAMRSIWRIRKKWNSCRKEELLRDAISRFEACLEKVQASGDWRQIPSLINLLADHDLSIRGAAARAIADLAAKIPVAELVQFENRLRESILQAVNNGELGLRELTEHKWPLPIWALFSLHPSGFVREAAIRHFGVLGNPTETLPYLLLRANDWVAQVRMAAIHAIRSTLVPNRRAEWIPLLGLTIKLHGRSRADHTWLNADLEALFLRPGEFQDLTRAAHSDDPAIARWAFAAAMRLEPTERMAFVRIGFELTDPTVRLLAAVEIRNWMTLPDRGDLLDRMKRDRLMPVRREALHAMLDEPSDNRRQHLLCALSDRHASIRHAARVYLQQDAERAGMPFCPRDHYVELLGKVPQNPPIGVVGGLGECGNRSDVAAIAPLVDSQSPSLAAAAIRAVANLDRDNRESWFASLIGDPRSAVAKQAARALERGFGAGTSGILRENVRRSESALCRRLSLRLLLRAHPHKAIVDVVNALGSTDPELVHLAREFLKNTPPWRVRLGPSDEQKSAVLAALSGLQSALPDEILAKVKIFMSLPID